MVLAAGASRRLGRPKQLVSWRGEALVHRAARAALEAGLDPVVVVIAPGAAEVRATVADLPVEVVEGPRAGPDMASSVRAGVARVAALAPGHDAVALVACDQPAVDAAHLGALAAARRVGGAAVVASEYAGVLGVPAVIGAELRGELAALRGDAGAREILRRDPARVARVPLPGGERDVDRPEDVDVPEGVAPPGVR